MPERVISRYTTGRGGPTVVLIGGLHGNEPAGAQAIARVLARLEADGVPLRGEVTGLAGNLAALAEDRRFLSRDLNRRWMAGDIEELLAAGSGREAPEDREQRELLAALVPLLVAAREPIVFLDLHSTSGDGPPFACMADVLRNRPIALALPIPLILGIEEILDGSLLGYLCDLGHVGVAVEGGQSQDPRTVRHHEAAIWIALVAAGCLDAPDVPDLGDHRALLAVAAKGLPSVVEIRHRHHIQEGDGFVMEPGLRSFVPVGKGQVVARDGSGPVRAPEKGLMLMPRYQGQGEDGYFLARRVSPLWLRLSALLRRLRLDRAVPLLPGVQPHPQQPDQFVANPRIAVFQVVNVFHLFGYRHVRPHRERLVFARRRPDFRRLGPLPPEIRSLRGGTGPESA